MTSTDDDPVLRRRLERLSSRVGREHRDGATGDPRPNAVGATRQDDRHARPEDDPGAVGVGEEAVLLARTFPASRSGAMRMSGSPATSERMPFVLAASLLMALSKASGHPALRRRSAAARTSCTGRRCCRVAGNPGRDRLHRGEHPHPSGRAPRGQPPGRWRSADVDFVLQRRRVIDGRVGDNQDLVVGRHVHDEHVAQSTSCAQASLSRDDRTEQLVGVQAAFHQELGLPLTNQLHRLGGRCVAVSGVDHTVFPRSILLFLAIPVDLAGKAHKNGRDQPLRAGLDGPGQADSRKGARRP